MMRNHSKRKAITRFILVLATEATPLALHTQRVNMIGIVKSNKAQNNNNQVSIIERKKTMKYKLYTLIVRG